MMQYLTNFLARAFDIVFFDNHIALYKTYVKET